MNLERGKTEQSLIDRYELEDSLQGELKDVIAYLSYLPQRYPKYENLRLKKVETGYYESSEEYFLLVGDRDETDREWRTRIRKHNEASKKQEAKAKKTKEKELKQLKRLMSKYKDEI